MRVSRREQGFSQVELLVAALILGVLAAVAVQGFAHARAAVGAGVAQAAVMESLLAAQRHSAVHRSKVVLCASEDGIDCSHSTHWERGWIAFMDRNGDRRRQPDEDVLQRVAGFDTTNIRTSSGRTRIVMQGYGGVANGSNATIVLCDHRGPGSASAVILSNSGNVRIGRANAKRLAADCP